MFGAWFSMRVPAMRPLTILSVLLVLAIAGSVWLTSVRQSDVSDERSEPPAPADLAPSWIAKVDGKEVPDQRMSNMENMVEYLQDQVKALEKDNKALREQLAAKSGKVEVTPCSPPSKPMLDDDAPDFTGIGIELVKTRGLRAIPLRETEVKRAEIEEAMLAWLKKGLPAGYGRAQGRAFAALGAIPTPVDTIELKASFLSHQIGTWYDVDDETLHLVRNPDAERENALGLAFGHLFREYADRLFPANAEPLTTDERLARECLLSGDAAFTRLLHSLSNPAKGGGGGVGEDPDDPSRTVPIPNFLRELALVPFGSGMEFVKALHSLGEFEQVNAAYDRPPLSGAEILDTQIYLADEAPVLPTITWPDVKLNGAAPIWDDRLGPLCMVLILKQFAPDAIAVGGVAGWANDRCLVYATKDGPRDHVAWQTLWKDADSADGFFSAMRQSLLSRYRDSKPDAAAAKGVFRLVGPIRHVTLQRTHGGKGVLYVDAADAATADALTGRLILK